MKKKPTEAAIAERVELVWRVCRTYGELEVAAGVTDRIAFWKQYPDEAAVKVALRERIAERVRREMTTTPTLFGDLK